MTTETEIQPKPASETTIPEQYARKGMCCRILRREGAAAIYEVSQADRPESTWRGWETVEVRRRPAREWPPGVIRPAGEYLPSPEEWGDHGWSYTTLADAEAKMQEILGWRASE